MALFTGTNGGTIDARHDEDGVYIRARYTTACLSPGTARQLAADLIALADDADAWQNAALDPYRS